MTKFKMKELKMKELPKLVNETTIKVIEGVISTGLPIVVTGGLGTGKSSLAEAIANDFGYGYLDEIRDYLIEDITKSENRKVYYNLVTTLKEGRDNKIVLAVENINDGLKDLIGPYIHLKTFRNDITFERYIHIMPALPVNENNSKKLGTEVKSQLVYGIGSSKYKSDVFYKSDSVVVKIKTKEELKSLVEMIKYQLKIIELFKEDAEDTLKARTLIFDIDATEMEVTDLVNHINFFNLEKNVINILVNVYREWCDEELPFDTWYDRAYRVFDHVIDL